MHNRNKVVLEHWKIVSKKLRKGSAFYIPRPASTISKLVVNLAV